jgi:hypothetical protein
MASTHCRAYDLTPDDIEVRDTGMPDEMAVIFGGTIGIQGPPQQLHALLRVAAERVVQHGARLSPPEPF